MHISRLINKRSRYKWWARPGRAVLSEQSTHEVTHEWCRCPI